MSKFPKAATLLLLFSCRYELQKDPPLPFDECSEFATPARFESTLCEDPSVTDPKILGRCLQGSGHPGRWTVDPDGLPAYDFLIEQRCDPAGRHFSPRPSVQKDPIHLLGNGRGLVAMAHASGGVEIYSQDRGHKWINRVDTWVDPINPEYPPQLGGGFSYLVHDGEVLSTRFEDLPVGLAQEMQSRRFGVGYYETVTSQHDLSITRRTFAPDSDVRALVSEVTIENRTNQPQTYGLIELWDVNLHQIPEELLTSDLLAPSITEQIDRKRRNFNNVFTHQIEWDASRKVALVETTADLPEQIQDRLTVSKEDFFPDPMFMAALDSGVEIDGVWLLDSELWQGTDRTPPLAFTQPKDASSKTITSEGFGQPVVLAVRVPVTVPAGGKVTRHFAFGYVPEGRDFDEDLSELQSSPQNLSQTTQNNWKDRLVWAAFPGLPDAGVIQREIAWASYNMLANTTFDEYHNGLLAGQGGSYKYIHGLDGAIGDLALFADTMNLIDPKISRDTLRYALSTQQITNPDRMFRYPYATTGVGTFSDVGIYFLRSDAYYLVPTAVGHYLSLTRDETFLDEVVPYWPLSEGQSATVLEHLRQSVTFGTQTLGIGARGLVAMGTGDYADGVTNLSSKEEITPEGSSSTYNAGFVIWGFPLAAEMLEGKDPSFAQSLRDLVQSQTNALNQEAFEGRWYLRGFTDNGNPLAPEIFFLEPQVFPILAGIVDNQRRDLLFDNIEFYLETSIGAMSNTSYKGDPNVGGVDQPQVSGIWPVANAWLTEAYAMRDPVQGWDSFVRNTLSKHAEIYPDVWYGIWTGPDSFNGPEHPRAGEADAHLATALTDYPAINAHMHSAPIRALQGILGINGTKTGLKITPRIPIETFHVIWPRLTLNMRPDQIEASYTSVSTAPITLEISLPSGLQGVTPQVRIEGAPIASTVTDNVLRFTLPAVAETPVSFTVSR